MPKHYRVKVDAARCKSCELCVPVCPKHIMTISDRKNELGFPVAECTNQSVCIGCLACAEVCPEIAIEITREDAP